MNPEYLSIIIAFCALIVSVGAIYNLYKNRIETNRPIVTVLIENDSGNISTPLTIKIYNTGNTPALDVTISAKEKNIDKAIASHAPKTLKTSVYKCLSENNIISVIHNNSNVENSFGLLSNDNNNVFNLNSKIPIEIKYTNIYGKIYTQKQILNIKITDNFAGSGWSKG